MPVEVRSRKIAPIDLQSLEAEPLVSVIVANYNYARFLPDAVDSVLAQTYENWELIVCDDGSTDDSREVLRDLESRDGRISVVLKENGGQASAWNHAFAYAGGEIIALLDSDDTFRENKLAVVVETFRRRPSSGFLYHQLQPIDAVGNNILSPFPDDLPEGWLADAAMRHGGIALDSTTTLCMRREIASLLFPIPEEIQSYGDAYLGQCASLLTEISALDQTLTFYRQHDLNHSGWFDPFEASLSRDRIDEYIVVFECQRAFVTDRFGAEVGAKLRLEDFHVVWDELAGQYVLQGKPGGGVRGYSPDQILAKVSPARRRHIWRALFFLPTFVGRWLLAQWWSRSWWKPIARSVSRRFGIAIRNT